MSIFDVTNHKRTTLSMQIDDTCIYSVSLSSVVAVSSGANTVGAFRSDNASSLYAWLDPVSGRFLKTSDISLQPAQVMPSVLVVLLGALGGRYFGMPEQVLVQASILSILLIALIFAIKSHRSDKKLENKLRAALLLNPTP